METFELKGWFADFGRREFFQGTMTVTGGRIAEIRVTGESGITWAERQRIDRLILPGLVDAHVHIESSMLMPSRFAAQAVRFGTVATVSDPHEIANVLGIDGIRLMLGDAAHACIRVHFTAPSCVPATTLETSGATLGAEELEPLFANGDVVALGEMMNYPGVVYGDQGVMKKIALAKRYGKSVDGHAPGLTGSDLLAYVTAGIDTDHECSTILEAREKIVTGHENSYPGGELSQEFRGALAVDR